MKKKSTILTMIAIICIALALYFMRQETIQEVEDPEEEIEEEVEDPEEEQPKRRSRKKTEDPIELIPDIEPEKPINDEPAETVG